MPILTVEHENDNNIQDEVWKLACWKSRLKVLITYHDDDNQADSKRRLAAEIIQNIQSSYENERTEWLILSAPRAWGDRLQWRAHEWREGGWRSLD